MLNRAVHGRPVQVVLALLLVGAGAALVAYGLGPFPRKDAASGTPTATAVVERLIPTAGPVRTAAVSGWLSPEAAPLHATTKANDPVKTPIPTAVRETSAAEGTEAIPEPESPATPGSAAHPRPEEELYTPRQRMGVVAPLRDIERYDVARLGAGWYISCQQGQDPVAQAGMECAQLVGPTGGLSASDSAQLREVASRHLGLLWLVDNEPDVIWQANDTPEEYARKYHDVYQAVKGGDPTSQVAIGGISQVTPLRLRYLDAILAAYERLYGAPMPVDVWNIHVAILREERGTWGVDIPPGLPDDAGILYEIEDNGDIEVLKGQVVAFRRWMAERGLRDRPLIVSEFSVLMPAEYGFPPERVQAFMVAAFDFLMTAADAELGCPADGSRLVQRWAWYSVADRMYGTGNLFDPGSGQMTALGRVYAAYAARWQ